MMSSGPGVLDAARCAATACQCFHRHDGEQYVLGLPRPRRAAITDPQTGHWYSAAPQAGQLGLSTAPIFRATQIPQNRRGFGAVVRSAGERAGREESLPTLERAPSAEPTLAPTTTRRRAEPDAADRATRADDDAAARRAACDDDDAPTR